MKKTLRFFLAGLALMLAGNVMAQGITFDFDNDYAKLFPGLAGTSANDSHDGDFNEATTSTAVGGFSVTVSAKNEGVSNANRIWSGAPRLRMYSGTFTVSGKGIKKIEFTSNSNFNISTTTGSLNGKTWTGEADEVVFTVAKNTQINKLVINGEGGDTPAPQPDPSLIGKGTLESPYTVADAIMVTGKLAQGEVSVSDYYIKGKVSSIKYTFSAQYGTATFNISEDGTANNEFTVYSAYYLENKSWTDGDTQIAVGDEVIVYGKVTNYSGTLETSSKNAYVYSLNGQTKAAGSEQPQPQVKTVSVAEALTAINALADGAKTSDNFIVRGYIVGTPDFQRNTSGALYGNVNLDIADEQGGAATLTVFRAKNFDNTNFDEETISSLKEGDFVEFQGLLQKYVKGGETTPELVSGYLISVNGKDAAGVAAVKTGQDANAPAYSLSGQQVSGSYRGLVVKNGRKYIVK